MISWKTRWISLVIGPGSPITWSSISRIGTTSAAVPVKNASSAMTMSARVKSRSATGWPSDAAIVITVSRVMPSSRPLTSGGVTTCRCGP